MLLSFTHSHFVPNLTSVGKKKIIWEMVQLCHKMKDNGVKKKHRFALNFVEYTQNIFFPPCFPQQNSQTDLEWHWDIIYMFNLVLILLFFIMNLARIRTPGVCALGWVKMQRTHFTAGYTLYICVCDKYKIISSSSLILSQFYYYMHSQESNP